MHTLRRFTLFSLAMIAFGWWGWGQQAPRPAGEEATTITIGFEREHGEEYQAPKHRVVDDPQQAHGGRHCLVGEITQPATYCMMTIPVLVSEGTPINVALWARADNGSRLAVWVRQGAQRRNLGTVESVGREWRRYAFEGMGVGDGQGQIEVVGPSSMGNASPGKMWLDDISVRAAAPPKGLRVAIRERVEDFPALAADTTGVLWSAWLLSENARERIEVARLRAPEAGKDFCERERVWRVEMPADAALAEPSLAAAGGKVWLAFAAEVAGQWDLYVCQIGPDGPGKPEPVLRDAAVDVRPALCVDADGKLWIAWESNREGERAIYAASRQADGAFSPPERVSTAGSPAYNPSVAPRPGGIAVAYDSFRDSNADIYLRARNGGRWEPERRLTSDPRLERHPLLAAHGQELWVAWQFQEFNTKQYSLANINVQGVRAARIEPAGLGAPLGMANARFAEWASRPTLAFDPDGRLWLGARRSLGQHEGWDTLLYCYSGGQWSARFPLVAHQGRLRPTPLLFVPGKLIAAEQVDDLPQSWPTGFPNAAWHSNVVFPSLDLARAPAPAALQTEVWQAPPSPDFDLKGARAQRGEDAGRYSIDYEGKRLSVYWGDFHEHSGVSVCGRRMNPPPDDLWANLHDIARLDFAGITDHGYNIDPYIWGWTGKYARMNYEPGRFVSFLAEEWTSDSVPNAEHPEDRGAPRRYGHRNIFFADPFFPRWFNARDGSTPKQVWDALRGTNYVMMPHQLADTGNCPTDWTYTDELRQPVAEIYQGRGSYEYLGCPQQPGRALQERGHYIQDAWAQGVIIGVIASPDHGGGRGKAAVYAERLDREPLLDAVRARHTYGTTGAKILLEMRVNGHLMGEKLPPLPAGQPVDIVVRVTGASDLASVEVCRNNEFIYKRDGDGRSLSFTYRDVAPPAGRLWYYARVIQKDGEMAWSSPVWLQ